MNHAHLQLLRVASSLLTSCASALRRTLHNTRRDIMKVKSKLRAGGAELLAD
jgi:hypothetical protein